MISALRRETKKTILLAIPLIIGQLSQMLLGLVDSQMLGKVGKIELAGLALVNALFFMPFIFGVGVLTSVSVTTSKAFGMGDPELAQKSVKHGLSLSLVLGLIAFVVCMLSWRLMVFFGQPMEVVKTAEIFCFLISLSIIPALASTALKTHVDALNRPWPAFWISLAGVLVNIVLNIFWIYGRCGFSAMGLTGAGYATLTARIVIFFSLWLWFKKSTSLKEWLPEKWFGSFDFELLKDMVKRGTASGLQMLTEVSAFCMTGVVIGKCFGVSSLAAHQIALTCAGTSFMIPLGLSMALTIRVSEMVGRGEAKTRLRAIMISGWVLSAAYSLVGGGVLYFLRYPIIQVFTDQQDVISIAASIFAVVAIFQGVDCLQICSVSMLRGLHDSKIPALMGFGCYWIIGTGIAWFLLSFMNLGAEGVWWGLAGGLASACLLLSWRLWVKSSSASF